MSSPNSGSDNASYVTWIIPANLLQRKGLAGWRGDYAQDIARFRPTRSATVGVEAQPFGRQDARPGGSPTPTP